MMLRQQSHDLQDWCDSMPLIEGIAGEIVRRVDRIDWRRLRLVFVEFLMAGITHQKSIALPSLN
jgi:hypothetical protein